MDGGQTQSLQERDRRQTEGGMGPIGWPEGALGDGVAEASGALAEAVVAVGAPMSKVEPLRP